MKKKKPNYYKEIVVILDDLGKTYPSYGLGRHLSTAFSEYTDLWGISDKDILFALTKYRAELSYDTPHPPIEDLEQLKEESKNLTIFNINEDFEDGQHY